MLKPPAPCAPAPQVEKLQQLLPGMGAALRRMKPAELVRMAAQLEAVASQLVALRARFPSADVAAMVAAHPPLLRMPAPELEAAVAAVAAEFPDATQVGWGRRARHAGAALPMHGSDTASLLGCQSCPSTHTQTLFPPL